MSRWFDFSSYQVDKNVVRDVAVIDMLPQTRSYTNCKEEKYAGKTAMPTMHTFVPLAFETLDPICSKALFLRALDRRLTFATNDKCATMFLFQKLLVVVLKSNAMYTLLIPSVPITV